LSFTAGIFIAQESVLHQGYYMLRDYVTKYGVWFISYCCVL